MAYVIFGATGHIGNNLVRYLASKNEEVVVVVRKIDKSIENLNVLYVVCEINEETIKENIKKDDIVINLLGAIDIKNNKYEETYYVNFTLTSIITKCAILKEAKRYVYISSVDAIYKENDEIVTEPLHLYPEKFKANYPKTKAMGTNFVISQMQKSKTSIAVIYPSAVIGINDYKPSQIGKVFQDVIKGKMEFGVRGGYNFVDVLDVVCAIYEVSKSCENEQYLITGQSVSVFELYEAINEVLNKKRKIIKIPYFLALIASIFVPYLSKFTLKTLRENHNYDSSKIIKQYNIKITPFKKTVKNTITWFLEEK